MLRAEVSVHTAMTSLILLRIKRRREILRRVDAKLRKINHIKLSSVSLMTIYPNSENQRKIVSCVSGTKRGP